MILMGFTVEKVLISVLSVSLFILILAIAYRRFLAHLGKSAPVSADYCVLFGLEKQPSTGEIEFYFTSTKKRNVQFEILKDDLSHHLTVKDEEMDEGGHIIRFDSNQLPDGQYYYQLKTENQKTMKRFRVKNA